MTNPDERPDVHNEHPDVEDEQPDVEDEHPDVEDEHPDDHDERPDVPKVIEDSANEAVDQQGSKGVSRSRNLLSRRMLVWLVAIVSQALIIGGVFTWSYYLAKNAIGSAPANTTAVITVWISDPQWHVAPELDVGQHSWMITLSTPQGRTFAASHPNAEALVVLWGNAELSDPHPVCFLAIVGSSCANPMSSAAPGSYEQIQVPQDQAAFYVQNFLTGNVPGFPGPTVPVQVFHVTAREWYAIGPGRKSVFPVGGQPSSSLETTTSTGWSAFVPSAAGAGVSANCSAAPAPLPAAIASAVAGAASQGWYGTSCPTPTIKLFTGLGERFSDSTVPPSTMATGIPTWTNRQAGSKSVTPSVGGFWLDVADPAIAATAQRDLFFAGVLAGIAGGLLAAWLAQAVIFLVKTSNTPKPQLGPGEGAHPIS